MSSGAVPRRAATVVVLRDDPLRVLMVKRNARGTFASALAFPGGVVDPEDAHSEWLDVLAEPHRWGDEARALRIAAVREVHEETGLIVAADADLDALPPGVSTGGVRELLSAHRVTLDLDLLVPFGHWVTPPTLPRRFDTRFFVVADRSQQGTLIDGAEIVDHEWAEPRELIARADAGSDLIMFPTFATLSLVAQHASVDDVLDDALNRTFERVEPWTETLADGSSVVRINADSGYALVERRMLPGE